MNMKKTIAAVAAGAMAVSAMATSVSAITIEDLMEGQTFTYNLVGSQWAPATLGTVTVTATISDLDLDTNDAKYLYAYIKVPTEYTLVSVTTNGYYENDYSKQIPSYTRFKGINADQYYPSLDNNYIKIPITESTVAGGAWLLNKKDTTLNFQIVLNHNKLSISDVNADIFQNNAITIDYMLADGQMDPDAASGAAQVVPVSNTADIQKSKGIGDKGTVSGYRINTKKGIFEEEENVSGTWTEVDGTTTVKAVVVQNNPELATMAALNFSAKTDAEYKIPFETSLDANKDIVKYLLNNMGYKNFTPVVNDLIDNYGTVTFTFNTATSGIKWSILDGSGTKFYDPNGDGIIQDEDWYSDFYKSYEEAYRVNVKSDGTLRGTITPVYSTKKDNNGSYQSFAQNLYTGTGNGDMEFLPGWLGFTSENTGYYGGLWNQNNLFNGALVINENITMNLSQVEAFDYGEKSITFDWDATYLQSMKLATTSRWYWDNLVVTGADLYAAEAEDNGRYNATAGAGETAAESEITIPEADETDPAELTVPTEAETQADTTADTTAEASETEAAEQPAENPKTGNAPVALAVIPVALAAAAVVAKKRS